MSTSWVNGVAPAPLMRFGSPMGIDYVVDRPCDAKRTHGLEGLVAMVKAREPTYLEPALVPA